VHIIGVQAKAQFIDDACQRMGVEQTLRVCSPGATGTQYHSQKNSTPHSRTLIHPNLAQKAASRKPLEIHRQIPI